MISLYALLSLTIKWTRIHSSTAWQQGKKHGGSSTEASWRLSAAYCQRNKLTKSFRPLFILNLRLQRDHRCIKRNNTFSVLNTPQKTDSDTWGRVAEVLRKTIFVACVAGVERGRGRSSVTDKFGKVLPILYCGRYHAISVWSDLVWSRTPVPRHTPRSNETIF